MADRTTSPSLDPVVDGAGLALAVALAGAVFLVALHRADPAASPVVELDRAAWTCTAEHVDKLVTQRADGGVAYETARVCDAWGWR